MNPIFEIKGDNLKSSYSIYIIEFINKNISYFYIGQTGDNYVHSARSPFGRLAGHLSTITSSTQNQIYKFAVKKAISVDRLKSKESFSKHEKKIIEEYLIKSVIKFYSYPLIEFNFNDTEITHKEKHRKIVETEKHIIHLFEQKNKELINNKKSTRNKFHIYFPEFIELIIKNFDL